jgi:molybdate transport system substrate-binding protein
MTAAQGRLTRRSVGALAIALPFATRARAQTNELRIFAAGATKSLVEELGPRFEREAGVKLVAAFDTVGALRDRVLKGEAPDMVLLSAVAVKAIADRQPIPSGMILDLGRTGVALAQPRGRAPAQIDTPEKFRDFLMKAGVIGYADPARGATAGTQFKKAIDQLGLAEPLKDKLKVYPFGVEVIAAVGKGELDVGVSQATEIVTHATVSFVGFLPDALQVWTIYQAAAQKNGFEAVGG